MAAGARGLEPIARGWLVRHGPDGAAHEDVVTDFNDAELDRAMAELKKSPARYRAAGGGC